MRSQSLEAYRQILVHEAPGDRLCPENHKEGVIVDSSHLDLEPPVEALLPITTFFSVPSAHFSAAGLIGTGLLPFNLKHQ